MNRAKASFEAHIFRTIVELDEDPEFAKYVQLGKLGKYGVVRYVLAKDVARLVNERMDAENFSDPSAKKDKEGVTSQTVTNFFRDQMRFPVERAGSRGGGNAIALDREKIAAGKFRFGMNEVDLEEKPEPKQMQIGE